MSRSLAPNIQTTSSASYLRFVDPLPTFTPSPLVISSLPDLNRNAFQDTTDKSHNCQNGPKRENGGCPPILHTLFFRLTRIVGQPVAFRRLPVLGARPAIPCERLVISSRCSGLWRLDQQLIPPSSDRSRRLSRSLDIHLPRMGNLLSAALDWPYRPRRIPLPQYPPCTHALERTRNRVRLCRPRA